MKVIQCKQGDIYMINFEKLARPIINDNIGLALITQNDVGNHFSPTTIVAPIIEKHKVESYNVSIKLPNFRYKDSNEYYVLLDAQYTIDKKSRFLEKVSSISNEDLNIIIAQALKVINPAASDPISSSISNLETFIKNHSKKDFKECYEEMIKTEQLKVKSICEKYDICFNEYNSKFDKIIEFVNKL